MGYFNVNTEVPATGYAVHIQAMITQLANYWCISANNARHIGLNSY